MKVYYVSIKKANANSAGSKAPSDISSILRDLGYCEYLFPDFVQTNFKIFEKLWILFVGSFYWLKLLFKVKKDDIVIFQHPMYGIRLFNLFIPQIKKIKKTELIVFIHDLDSLRGKISGVVDKSIKVSWVADNFILKRFDVVICHNEKMKAYLLENGFEERKLICLDLFDYLSFSPINTGKRVITNSISIAGNLAEAKCSYVYRISNELNDKNLMIHLYGKNFNKNLASKNLIYHGIYSPEELPGFLAGDYGLVWDGNETNTCAGNAGEYLKYNTPHKTSLYLSAGIPIIVWKDAAIAEFITQNNLGITIDSLQHLHSLINSVSKEQYVQMRKNAQIIGNHIRNGYYTKRAIKNAMDLLERN